MKHRRSRRVLAVVVVSFLIGPASAPAITVVRGPYLGRADDRSITIIWRTDQPASGAVRLFDSKGALVSAAWDESIDVQHQIRLTNVESGAAYRYEVMAGNDTPLAEGSARAPLWPSVSTFRFGVFGDTDHETPRQIAELLNRYDIRFALHTGDVVYPTGAAADYDPNFFTLMEPWLARAVMLPTMGNHDAITARGQPLLRNFVMPRNGDPESRYYSVREGDALFVCLDVETSPYGAGSPQYKWLQKTLRETDATWKFVWFHEPPYSSATSNEIIRFILVPLLERSGVDIVFCGHEHLYERTMPIRDFVPGGPGVVYITAGGGGGEFTRFEAQQRSAVVAARHGIVVIDISGSALRGLAVDTDGTVFDAFAISKSAATRRRVVRK